MSLKTRENTAKNRFLKKIYFLNLSLNLFCQNEKNILQKKFFSMTQSKFF